MSGDFNRTDDMTSSKLLICCVGLPYSGKSSWARKQTYPVVNPDSIRVAMHGYRYIARAEPFVWAIARVMVRSLFLAGHNIVILDATNTTRKRRDAWQSEGWATMFKEFDATRDECYDRAVAADDDKILGIIDKMAIEAEPLADDEVKA